MQLQYQQNQHQMKPQFQSTPPKAFQKVRDLPRK